MAKTRARKGRPGRPRRGPTLTLEQLQAARDEHQNGAASLQQIADRHGVSRWSLTLLLESIGYTPRRGAPAPPPKPARRKLSITMEQLVAARVEHEQGALAADLAAKLNVNPSWLTKLWTRELGYSAASRRRPPKKKPDTIIHIRPAVITDARRGLSVKQLAARWHIAPLKVREVLAEAGIAISTRCREPERDRPIDTATMPRLVIPIRRGPERRIRAWAAAELEAIDVEVRARRLLFCPRGWRGLERVGFVDAAWWSPAARRAKKAA